MLYHFIFNKCNDLNEKKRITCIQTKRMEKNDQSEEGRGGGQEYTKKSDRII